jgi:cytochrome c oxidase subunit 1
VHFVLTFIGATLNWLPLHWAGLYGMPRRVASYDPEFAIWNVIASIGAFMVGVAAIPFILNIVSSWARGAKAPPNPWNAIGLEWLLPSPPPSENFEDDVPTVISAPYGYGLGQPLVEDEEYYVRRALEA